MTPQQVQDVLYNRSGLLGVSEISSDMRTLLASGDPRAAEAIELFVFRMVREIGALTATLGGLDAIVFTAGIGENAPEIRRRVCERLAFLGVELDPEANLRNATRLGASGRRVQILVIPTDEERMIARHTLSTIGRADVTS